MLAEMLNTLHSNIDSNAYVQRIVDALDHTRTHSLRPLATKRPPAPEYRHGSATFSVIVPCYNYGRFLGAAVGSVLDQQGVATEVIIVDDASTDDTAEVGQDLAALDRRVRYIRNRENLGHVRTFNVGCEQAAGEFIVRLDADDLIAPGAFARAAALFEHFPSVGLVYGHPRHFSSETPPPALQAAVGWTVWKGEAWLGERFRTGLNCITTPEAIVRASVVRQVGPLRTELRFAQDMEMWMRVAAVSDVGHIDGPDQALHRDHDGSMSVTVAAGALTDLIERRTVFALIIERMGQHLSDPDSLDDLARRTLAVEALRGATHAYDRGRADEIGAEDLVGYACETWSNCHELAQWRALRRRQRIGARRARKVPICILSALMRRIDTELQYARWSRHGI